jgi:hypothetical protein
MSVVVLGSVIVVGTRIGDGGPVHGRITGCEVDPTTAPLTVTV